MVAMPFIASLNLILGAVVVLEKHCSRAPLPGPFAYSLEPGESADAKHPTCATSSSPGLSRCEMRFTVAGGTAQPSPPDGGATAASADCTAQRHGCDCMH